MKLMKHIFCIILIIGGINVLFSCSNKHSFSCDCYMAGKRMQGQNYNIGNTSYSDASGKCNAFKQQNVWDTCLAVEAN